MSPGGITYQGISGGALAAKWLSIVSRHRVFGEEKIPYIVGLQIVDLAVHIALGLREYEMISASAIVFAVVGFS